MATTVGTLSVRVTAETRALVTGLSRGAAQVRGFTSQVQGYMQANRVAIQRMVRVAKIGAIAVVASITMAIKSFADFEQAMVTATAVSTVTGKQFREMSRMAEDMAKKWGVSAANTAQAFYYLGSAGLAVQEQIAAFPAVTTLAKAAIMDMGATTEMVVDTMKGFKIPFTDTTRVTDILAKSVTSSNMTFGQLGEALSLVAGIARNSNTTLEETTAILGLMANVGIKGSRAGTTLRRALINLSAPASEARDTLKNLKVEIYDSEGKMKSFGKILADLVPVLNASTEQTRNMALKQLFGARAIAGMTEMVYQGAEGLGVFTSGLKKAGGTAETVARKQVATVQGSFKMLWQEIMVVVRSLGKRLKPEVMEMIRVFKDFAEQAEKNKDGMNALASIIASGMRQGLKLALGLAFVWSQLVVWIDQAAIALDYVAIGFMKVENAFKPKKWEADLLPFLYNIKRIREEIEDLRESQKLIMKPLVGLDIPALNPVVAGGRAGNVAGGGYNLTLNIQANTKKEMMNEIGKAVDRMGY